MDIRRSTCYTPCMKRGPKPKDKEEIKVTVGLKVLPKIKREIERIIQEHKDSATGRITEAWITEKLFMRGLESYRHDRKFIGPASTAKKARPIYQSKEETKEEAKKQKGEGGGK